MCEFKLEFVSCIKYIYINKNKKFYDTFGEFREIMQRDRNSDSRHIIRSFSNKKKTLLEVIIFFFF
jgi:hypothetical protein